MMLIMGDLELVHETLQYRRIGRRWCLVVEGEEVLEMNVRADGRWMVFRCQACDVLRTVPFCPSCTPPRLPEKELREILKCEDCGGPLVDEVDFQARLKEGGRHGLR